MDKENILEIKNLKQYFEPIKGYTVKAVDGVSFNIKEGEDTAYYRDLKGVHYVPKRRLEDIIYIPDSASNVRE